MSDSARGRMIPGRSSHSFRLPRLALLGIPGGIGLHHAVKRAGATPIPPVAWLAVMVVIMLVVITMLTAVPLLIDTRRPVAEALQSESA
jgi:hypothetical protein